MTGAPLDQLIADAAQRHGTSAGAAAALFEALVRGHGAGAQFDIAELGGRGQWMRGGMTMVGDMFNHALKAQVDGLCRELADLAARVPQPGPWPAQWGTPAVRGGQNGTEYAWFPQGRRLAVRTAGVVRVYDTGGHQVSGVSQQSGGAAVFRSQLGTFTVDQLPLAGADPEPGAPAHTTPAPPSAADPVAALAAVADLHRRGILTDEEFAAKKKDLLGRI